MLSTKVTPTSPSMMGTVKPSQSSSSRLTEPFLPKMSCNATAPTKGGMISGSTPSVWMASAPRNSKRTVRYASGTAMTLAKKVLASATCRLLKNDSRKTPWLKKLAKWPTVSAPVSVTKAV